MKHNSFLTLFLIVSLALFTACGGSKTGHSRITDQGIDPIVLGAKASDLPAQIDGLYDSFEVIVFEDTETGFMPSRTYAQFKRGDQIIIEADLNADDSETIESIYIFDPAITYKGIGAGTPLSEVLGAGAKLYMVGNYESCIFDSFFRLDGVTFAFELFNGGSFSQAKQQELYSSNFDELTEVPASNADFQSGATVSKICIIP